MADQSKITNRCSAEGHCNMTGYASRKEGIMDSNINEYEEIKHYLNRVCPFTVCSQLGYYDIEAHEIIRDDGDVFVLWSGIDGVDWPDEIRTVYQAKAIVASKLIELIYGENPPMELSFRVGDKIQRYTGLVDEKGAKIYEGDIIESYHCYDGENEYTTRSEVAYCGGGFYAKFISGSPKFNVGSHFGLNVRDDLAKCHSNVVGNINK
jgi:hypothetical protein